MSCIFDGSGIRNIKEFTDIKPIPFISLTKAYKSDYCLLNPPKIPILVSVSNKSRTGYVYDGKSYYEDGKWIDNKTGEVNSRIDAFSKWEISFDRVYVNGRIFIEDKIV